MLIRVDRLSNGFLFHVALFGMSLAIPIDHSETLSKRFLDSNTMDTFADPSIIFVGGTAYAYATNSIKWGGPYNVPVATNADFSNAGGWRLANYDGLSLGSWVDTSAANVPQVWAPDVNLLAEGDGSFVMYYSAIDKSGNRCTGVARSSSPGGPFKDSSGSPWDCPPSAWHGVIDASGFLDSVNRRWVVYKLDGAASRSTPLMLQQVDHDGSTKIGSAIQLYDNAGASDDYCVEAPQIHLAPDGTHFLFFSSGDTFSTTYTVSYVTSTSGVTGPYGNRQTLMRTGTSYCGQTFTSPGGADVTLEGANMVFHRGDASSGPRQLNTATLNFNGQRVSIAC